MKLYYSAGSCSTSCHISLEESGLKYEAIEVDWDDAKDPNLEVVNKLNALGTLPILITDDGKQLDQNLAIHTYIAEKAAAKNLFPATGPERIEALNLLSFVATDLHKGVGALFGTQYVSEDKKVQEAYRKFCLERANGVLKYLDTKLAGKDYLLGKNFSVIDAYAFVVSSWTKWLEVPITQFKNLQSYMERMSARPAVVKVMKDEGLT